MAAGSVGALEGLYVGQVPLEEGSCELCVVSFEHGFTAFDDRTADNHAGWQVGGEQIGEEAQAFGDIRQPRRQGCRLQVVRPGRRLAISNWRWRSAIGDVRLTGSASHCPLPIPRARLRAA